MSLAFQEFSAAVRELAGTGNRKQRLLQACSPGLINLPRKEIPKEIRPVFDHFTERLGHGARMQADDVDAAIRAADDTTVDELVGDILVIHDVLARYQPSWEPPLLVRCGIYDTCA